MDNRIKTVIIGIVTILVLGLGITAFTYYKSIENIGIKTLEYLYNFKDVYDLAEQDELLKEITTEEAYKYLTVTDSDKALNTYLKFKEDPVNIKVVESYSGLKGGYVIYNIENINIDRRRTFQFFYEVKAGKICRAKEMEGIDFRQTYDDVIEQYDPEKHDY